METQANLDRLNERACFALRDANIVVKAQADGLALYRCCIRVCGVPLLIKDSVEVQRFASATALETYLDECVARDPELRDLDRLTREACRLYDDPTVAVRKVKEGAYVIRHRERVRRTNVLKLRYNDCNYIPHNAYIDRKSVRQQAFVDHVSKILPTPTGFDSLSAVEAHLQKRAAYNEKQRLREAELTDLTDRARATFPDRQVSVVRGKRETDRSRFFLVFTDTSERREQGFDLPGQFDALLHGQRQGVSSETIMPVADDVALELREANA